MGAVSAKAETLLTDEEALTGICAIGNTLLRDLSESERPAVRGVPDLLQADLRRSVGEVPPISVDLETPPYAFHG